MWFWIAPHDFYEQVFMQWNRQPDASLGTTVRDHRLAARDWKILSIRLPLRGVSVFQKIDLVAQPLVFVVDLFPFGKQGVKLRRLLVHCFELIEQSIPFDANRIVLCPQRCQL